jgi:hypothetical protein
MGILKQAVMVMPVSGLGPVEKDLATGHDLNKLGVQERTTGHGEGEIRGIVRVSGAPIPRETQLSG